MGGGRTGPGSAAFAEKLGDIAARDIPRFVSSVLARYLRERAEAESFREYYGRAGKDRIRILLEEEFCRVPAFVDDPSYYYDWGSEEVFSLAGRSAGECSAGIFDFIERDLKNIAETVKKIESMSEGENGSQAALAYLVAYSVGMLLVTKGFVESGKTKNAAEFTASFIDTGLLSPAFRPLLRALPGESTGPVLLDPKTVLDFSKAAVGLYRTMDDNFQFPAARPAEGAGAPVGENTPSRKPSRTYAA